MIWWAAAVLAADGDSLRSDASFGLFRDEYDFLREPATLSEQAGHHLYTVLGNQGGTTAASLGALGALGPVVVGVIADGELSGSSGETTLPGYRSHSESTYRSGALIAGVGARLSERVGLGLGVDLGLSAWDASLAPGLGDPPVIGGTLVSDDELVTDGRWEDRDGHVIGVLGGSLSAGPLDVELDLRGGHSRTSGFADTRSDGPDGHYALRGWLPGFPLERNASGWLGGGTIDANLAVSERTALRLLVTAARQGLAPVITESSEYLTDSPDPLQDFARFITLSDPEGGATDADALLVAHWTDGALAVRAGVAVDAARTRRVVTQTLSWEGLTDVTTPTLRDALVTVRLPLAVEAAVGEKLVVRAGGQPSWSDVRYTQTSVGTTTGTTNRQTWVDLGLGLRAALHPSFSLDLVANGTGVPDQDRVAIDLSTLLASGVFHW